MRKHSGSDGWTRSELLLTDLFHAFTGNPHPARPQPKTESRYAKLRKSLEAQKERLKTQA
jgi:transcriptional regulator of met regulon